MIACFTGHRPNKLGGYDCNNPIRTAIKLITNNIIVGLYEGYGVDTYLSGMAQGYDWDAAWQVLHLRDVVKLPVKLHAYIPCEGQDAMWPASAKQEYLRLLELADEIVYINKGPYAAWKMIARNKAMVDASHCVIACWDQREEGGTWQTIKYARGIPKPIYIINRSSI